MSLKGVTPNSKKKIRVIVYECSIDEDFLLGKEIEEAKFFKHPIKVPITKTTKDILLYL